MNAGQIIGTLNGQQVVGAGHCQTRVSAAHRGHGHRRDRQRADPAHESARTLCEQVALPDHGARSVLAHAKEPGPWLERLKARRPANVVIVAQAAKMARTIWAVTAKQQDFQRGFQSVRPNATVQAV